MKRNVWALLMFLGTISPILAQSAPLQQAGLSSRTIPCPPSNPCPPGANMGQPYVPGQPYLPGQVIPGQPSTLPVDPNAPVTTPPSNTAQPIGQGQAPVDNLFDGNQFARAEARGGQGANGFDQNMFGDLIGVFGQRNISVGGRFSTATTRVRGIPIQGRYQGLKITDNESPRPIDRFYYTYNGFTNVGRDIDGNVVRDLTLSRHIIGFEKTFLEGNASFGMRLPFLSLSGNKDVESNIVGDLSFLFKYAFYNNRATGDVFSGGLIVTAPTGGGQNQMLADGTDAPTSTFIQPWLGGLYHINRDLYVMGFSSIVIPTDSRDPTILFNSLSAGYWLYRNGGDSLLQGFVPVVEVHVNTPLNHRSRSDIISFQDQVNATGGAFFVLPRATIGAAVCVPLISPRPYDIEAIASINFRF